MRQLTPDTIDAYLRDRGILGNGTLLTGGVSANVFRVETPEGRFVVKQSCPQLRTRDSWHSDVRRVFREVAVMRALGDVFTDDVVPRVIWVDEDNFAFAMSHSPGGPTTWKDDLLAGNVDFVRAEFAGTLLGQIHEFSHTHPEKFAEFEDVEIFRQLRIDPFYGTVARRMVDVADLVEPLIRDLHERRVALCHGDFTPKNMLLYNRGFTLVDYETATWGEPAFDAGLFLAHLTLKGLHRPDRATEFRQAIDRFRSAYERATPNLGANSYDARIRKHLGACLLSRTDGTSPAPYLADAERNRARALARELLHGGDWNAVANALET